MLKIRLLINCIIPERNWCRGAQGWQSATVPTWGCDKGAMVTLGFCPVETLHYLHVLIKWGIILFKLSTGRRTGTWLTERLHPHSCSLWSSEHLKIQSTLEEWQTSWVFLITHPWSALSFCQVCLSSAGIAEMILHFPQVPFRETHCCLSAWMPPQKLTEDALARIKCWMTERGKILTNCTLRKRHKCCRRGRGWHKDTSNDLALESKAHSKACPFYSFLKTTVENSFLLLIGSTMFSTSEAGFLSP